GRDRTQADPAAVKGAVLQRGQRRAVDGGPDARAGEGQAESVPPAGVVGEGARGQGVEDAADTPAKLPPMIQLEHELVAVLGVPAVPRDAETIPGGGRFDVDADRIVGPSRPVDGQLLLHMRAADDRARHAYAIPSEQPGAPPSSP